MGQKKGVDTSAGCPEAKIVTKLRGRAAGPTRVHPVVDVLVQAGYRASQQSCGSGREPAELTSEWVFGSASGSPRSRWVRLGSQGFQGRRQRSITQILHNRRLGEAKCVTFDLSFGFGRLKLALMLRIILKLRHQLGSANRTPLA